MSDDTLAVPKAISSDARAFPAPISDVRIVRASGSKVWDAAEREYLDFKGGMGASLLGYGNANVLEAIAGASRKSGLHSMPHYAEDDAGRVLLNRAAGMDWAVFSNSGSEATSMACEIAREATGRMTIAKFAGAYDGWLQGLRYGGPGSDEASFGSERPLKRDVTLLRFNDFEDVTKLFQENSDIAAVILEPMIANCGCLMPQPGYLSHVFAEARAAGALVIVDEVLVGLRASSSFVDWLDAPLPDMITLGKAIGGGGFPVSAVIGAKHLRQIFDATRYIRSGTYNGNPIAASAVLATNAILSQPAWDAAAGVGRVMREALVASLAKRGIDACTSGFDLVFTLWEGSEPPKTYAEAVARRPPKERTIALEVGLQKVGIIASPLAFNRVCISVSHTREEVEHAAVAIAEVLSSVRQ